MNLQSLFQELFTISHQNLIWVDKSCLYNNDTTISKQVCLKSVIRIAYQGDIRTASDVGNTVKKRLTQVVAWSNGMNLFLLLLHNKLSFFSFGI